MKMLRLIILNIITISLIFGEDPPLKWKEHWHEHIQLLNRVYFDDEVAVYFDNDVNKLITFPFKFLHDVWAYTKSVYGSFGEDGRLFVIFHTGKYGGCHMSTYFDQSHDYRNAIDCGLLDSNEWNPDKLILDLLFQLTFIVEYANHGVYHYSLVYPFTIWGDTLYQIYIYDVYLAFNLTSKAQQWQNEMTFSYRNYPRHRTYWFRDWYYPIYTNYEGANVFNKFFVLLYNYFPKDKEVSSGRLQYARKLNHGEFFHFWSGAANKNLKDIAIKAFCWNQTYVDEFHEAQKDFPKITYQPTFV